MKAFSFEHDFLSQVLFDSEENDGFAMMATANNNFAPPPPSPFKVSQLYTPLASPAKMAPATQTWKSSHPALARRRFRRHNYYESASANSSPVLARRNNPSAIPARLADGPRQSSVGGPSGPGSAVSTGELLDLLT